MNRILFTFIFILIAAVGQAQTAGYVVPENGDTLRGNVKLAQGYRTAPGAVVFTDASGNPGKTFTVSTCQAFALGDDVYQRATVTMDMSNLSTIDYNIQYADSMLTTTIFMKQLFKGPHLTLYKYYNGSEAGMATSNNAKPHFFISDGQKVQELIMKYSYVTTREGPFLNDRGSLATRQLRPIYREQLSLYFDWTKEKKLKRKLEDAEYREEHLVKIIDEINKKWDPMPEQQ